MLVAALVTAGGFPFITYIAPFLVEVTGVSASAGTSPGIFAGGRLTDRKLVPTLIGAIAFVTVIFVAIFLGSRSRP